MSTIPRATRPGILAVALALWAACGSALAAKTDVIYMRNGDRVTCEIKNLERGRLRVSTDSMGTVYIEWKDIAQLVSSQLFVAELQDGERVQGTLAMPFDDGTLVMTEGEASRRLRMDGIVWLDPLKLDERAIKRWDGSVSAGFDATKANSDTSLSASFDARRRAEDYVLNFDGSVYSRSQENAEDSLRASFGGVYRGLLEDRWYWAGLGSVERNDELGIDLRSLVGAGYGRYVVQSGRTLWSLTSGLAAVNEQLAGDEEAETSLEAFFNTDYEFFTYDTPKTSINAALTIFPSLTEGGRVRGSADTGIRRELIEDLFVDLSFYYSYDSDPPDVGSSSDWGLVTSLGYSF